MKPETVYFRDLRDWPWKRAVCPRCGCYAPLWHEHHNTKDNPAKATSPWINRKGTKHGND